MSVACLFGRNHCGAGRDIARKINKNKNSLIEFGRRNQDSGQMYLHTKTQSDFIRLLEGQEDGAVAMSAITKQKEYPLLRQNGFN